MKKLAILIVCLAILSVFSVNAFAQSLFVNPADDKLKNIENSKYVASSINVLRNSNGELISVVRTEASKYLPDPITDQFIDTLPIMKKGVFEKKNVEMKQVEVNYNYEKCITEMYQVP